jgi:dUTP pyrophosphatase
VELLVVRLPHGEGLPLPSRATAHAAGMDLVAAVDVMLAPGERKLVPTGLKVAVPEGYELQLRPRSGLALKHGISLPNTPATIDADYRGELQVILINFGSESFAVKRGDRIAQMLVQRVETVSFREVEVLPESGRGSGGFGSTGRRPVILSEGSANALPQSKDLLFVTAHPPTTPRRREQSVAPARSLALRLWHCARDRVSHSEGAPRHCSLLCGVVVRGCRPGHQGSTNETPAIPLPAPAPRLRRGGVASAGS